MTPADPLHATILAGYETVPYETGPHFPTHPARLFAVGRLGGLDPVSPARCRVLELGCGTGGNIIPMAFGLPDARFVGVDLSPSQIARGRALAQRVGLRNLRLEALDLMDLPDDLGTFDYVVCHGVYSWVPAPVRRRILEICGSSLSQRGLAYVSFNVYPGSTARDSARGLMQFALGRVVREDTGVVGARLLLEALADWIPEDEGAFKARIQSEVRVLAESPTHYTTHEYLEPVNQPFWLHEFVEAAEAAGLSYVDDAWERSVSVGLSADATRGFDSMTRDPLIREQLADFVRNRAFRRAVLRRSDAVPASPDPDRIAELSVSTSAWPVGGSASDAANDEAGGADGRYRTRGGATVTTNIPVVQAALAALYDAWPGYVPVTELHGGASESASGPVDLKSFVEYLRHLDAGHAVTFHALPLEGPATPVTSVTERPSASELARGQIAAGWSVTNLVHQPVELDPFGRAVLTLLDGSRSIPEVAQDPSVVAAWPGTPLDPGGLASRVEAAAGKAALSALLTG